MAEINIRKKRPVWPWVVIGLVLLSIVIYLAGNNILEDESLETEREEAAKEESEIGAIREGMSDSAPDPALTAYYEHIADSEGKMGIDHNYTHRAFTLLTNAMKATADEAGYNFNQDMSMLKERADSILKDPMKLDHANTIKHGFDQVVQAMNNMQQAGVGNIEYEVNTLEQYATNLEPSEPTLEQKELVKGFFDQAASILRTINDKS